jgi:hypothetical protein
MYSSLLLLLLLLLLHLGGAGSQIRGHAGFAQYLGTVLGAADLSPHLRVLVAGIMYQCITCVGALFFFSPFFFFLVFFGSHPYSLS